MPPTPSRRPLLTRFGVYAALLYLSWNHNLLGLPDRVGWTDDRVRVGALGSEANLVVARIARPELPTFHPLGVVDGAGAFRPYTSQVGLSGIVLAAVPLPPGWVAPAAAAGMCLLAAGLVAAVLVGGQRWLGPPAGDVACALAAASPVFLPFAPSLYWALGLMLLPFTLVWCLGPRATTAGRRALLGGAVGLAVLAKCLCGYEFVTTVILAPVAAAWFHQSRASEPLARRAAVAAALVGVGLAGFAGAVGLHVAQLERVFGADGVAVIRDRAASRTVGDPAAEVRPAGVSGPPRLGSAARCFWNFFRQRAVSVAGGSGRVRVDVPLKWVSGAALALAVAAALARQRLPAAAVGLAGAVPLGLAAGVSWQVLAVNHMCVHEHFNLVVFAVPFLLLAYLAFGCAAGRVAGPRVGPAGLLLVAAAMTANFAAADSSEAAADQRAAETAVAAALHAPRPSDPGVSGVVDTCGPAAAVPTTLLADYGWLDLRTGGADDPESVVASGWVKGDQRRAARPTTRVVAVVGERVVPCDQLRFRRPDIDALDGKPVPGAGFVVRVPSAVLVPGEPVRLFAAGRDGAVAELHLNRPAAPPASAPATPPAGP